MSSLERKLRRKTELEQAKYLKDVKSEAKKISEKVVDKAMARAHEAAYNEAVETATAKVMAVTAEILWNHWSELSRKGTRLQVFVKLMEEKLQMVDNPTEAQLEVERLLAEQCGIEFGRVEK